MTKFARIFFYLLISGALAVTACKKDDTAIVKDGGTSEQTHASDESQLESEHDQVISDAENLYANGGVAMGAGKTAGFSVCGATIDSVPGTKTYTLTFDSTTACAFGTRLRAGKITVQLSSGMKWSDKNAVLTIKYIKYRTIDKTSGKSLLFNGTVTVTNTTGGLVYKMVSGDSIVRTLEGQMAVTFDANNSRTWTHHVRRTWKYDGSVYTLTIEGTENNGTMANISATGTDRFGKDFTVQINTPIVANSTCGWFKPVSGAKYHTRAGRNITVTYGVDANGTAVASGCAYGFKVGWSSPTSGNGSAIVAY